MRGSIVGVTLPTSSSLTELAEAALRAWFSALLNAGISPQERRPDLTALVDLELQTSVPGGQLYLLKPLDPTSCRQR